MLSFDGPILQDLNELTRREWVVGNGIGGYASSTLCFLNTRRYHALLVASLNPPVERTVLVAKLEEEVHVGNKLTPLSSNAYPGAVHPEGYRHLVGAEVDKGVPRITFACHLGEVTKRVVMVHGENTTIVQYTWTGEDEATLVARPLITCRDYHWLLGYNPDFGAGFTACEEGAVWQPFPDGPTIHARATGGAYRHSPTWYYAFQLAREAYRGLNSEEALLSPGDLYVPLRRGEPSYIVLSTEPADAREADELFGAEIDRRAAVVKASPLSGADDRIDELIVAADSFIVRRGSGLLSVLAGYHWFSDWGRDTMIALPGLTLTTGRPDDCKQVLQTYARFVDQGMLPNRFPDSGDEPDYNTVDATLWYFVALQRYLDATADGGLATELLPVLTEIIDAHIEGTRFGIKVDDDGLLSAGSEATQLTWMDAKVDDWVVTPRNGKPVEIQALWLNALRVYQSLCLGAGDTASAERADLFADRLEAAFLPAFYDESWGFLADVLRPDGSRDMSLRPNQFLAMALPHKLVPAPLAKSILNEIRDALVTPVGPRSLSDQDPAYRGVYGGDRWSRDGAYHQGTVWAWPVGAYLDAYLYAHGNSLEARAYVRATLEPLLNHTLDAGLGSISEVFDGDPPHEPRGCVSQAWSVAEVLRVLGRLG